MMETTGLTAAASAIGVISALILVVGSVRLLKSKQTRTRGYLMIAAAAVIIMNVMIWTV